MNGFWIWVLVAAALFSGCIPSESPKKDSPTIVIATCDGGSCADASTTPVDCTTGRLANGCDLGSDCDANSTCASGLCGPAGRCVPSSCDNDVLDDDESGIDCGGPCPACIGESCSENGHCVSNYCKEGACSTPTCTDGVKNGLETSADCGGDCTPCPIGSACRSNADCQSGRCGSEDTCADPPASCQDGEKNGAETDLDCGGPECGACGQDRTCAADSDCLTEFCHFGVCKIPTCDDDAHNGAETDTDCGGPQCDACNDGLACSAPSDCQSGNCQDGSCVSCSDGVQNGDELGVDCGGSCDSCAVGESCQAHSDCSTGRCEDNVCCQPNACGFCGALPQEVCNGLDDDCDGQVDEQLTPPTCQNELGICAQALARCDGADGWVCDEAAFQALGDYTPGADAPCDGIDNDCDGQTDEEACTSNNPCVLRQCMGSAGNRYCGEEDAEDGTTCGLSNQRCVGGDCRTLGDRCRCFGTSCHYWYEDSALQVTVDDCSCSGNKVVAGDYTIQCSSNCLEYHYNGEDVYWCE